VNNSPISVLYVNSQDGNADPRTIWLDLPATKTAMDRAMKKIGFPDSTHTGASAVRYKTDIPGLAEHLTINPSFEYLNRLAASLSVMNRPALRRFALYLRTEDANNFLVILQRAQHLTEGRKRRRQAPAPGR